MNTNNTLQALTAGAVAPSASNFGDRFKGWLLGENKKNLKAVTALLGGEAEARRFLAIANNVLTHTPKLLECDIESFTNAVMRCAEVKLMPALAEAYILPYKGKAQLIFGYQGYVKLILQSGFYDEVWASVVREKDVFDYEDGQYKKLIHKSGLGTPAERGKRIAAYACAKDRDSGHVAYYLMPAWEVEAVKAKSQSAKSEYSPWNGDDKSCDDMWKKSAVRQLAKMLIKSSETQKAIEKEEAQESGEEAKPIRNVLEIDDVLPPTPVPAKA